MATGLSDLGVNLSFGLDKITFGGIVTLLATLFISIMVIAVVIFLMYITFIYKYKVHIYEINNERLVYSSDIGREIKKRDGRQYFRLFWSKKTLPPLDYKLVSPARKGFKKQVIHLIRDSQEGFNALKPKIAEVGTMAQEINMLHKKMDRITDEDEIEDIKRMIKNREGLLQGMKNHAIMKPVKGTNYNQFHAEAIMKSFIFEPVDLDVKNTHINMGKGIDGYKKASFMDKYGSVVISLSALAIAFVIIIITLEKTNDITNSIGQINQGLQQVANSINQGLVR